MEIFTSPNDIVKKRNVREEQLSRTKNIIIVQLLIFDPNPDSGTSTSHFPSLSGGAFSDVNTGPHVDARAETPHADAPAEAPDADAPAGAQPTEPAQEKSAAPVGRKTVHDAHVDSD